MFWALFRPGPKKILPPDMAEPLQKGAKGWTMPLRCLGSPLQGSEAAREADEPLGAVI